VLSVRVWHGVVVRIVSVVDGVEAALAVSCTTMWKMLGKSITTLREMWTMFRMNSLDVKENVDVEENVGDVEENVDDVLD
jgi:hypothetical protein